MNSKMKNILIWVCILAALAVVCIILYNQPRRNILPPVQGNSPTAVVTDVVTETGHGGVLF